MTGHRDRWTSTQEQYVISISHSYQKRGHLEKKRNKAKQRSKETSELNDTTEHMDLIDIYRCNAEQANFSAAHRTFSKVDYRI
jgi:hypothetical protein